MARQLIQRLSRTPSNHQEEEAEKEGQLVAQPSSRDEDRSQEEDSDWEERFLQGWSKSPIPKDMPWNKELRIGSYVRVDPGQEIRMRLWATHQPILMTFGLLSQFLHSGACFHLMINDGNMFQYRLPWPSSSGPILYSGHYRERTWDPTQDKHKFFQQWAATVTDIMRHPHARAYLFEGGLLWRLALEFGPEDLIKKALSGPSEAVTSFGIGLWDTAAQMVCDICPLYKLDVVLGRINGKSDVWWLPKPDIWETNHPAWTGIWNDEQEKTFQSLLHNMRNGVHKPHNLGTWAHDLAHLPCSNSEDIWEGAERAWKIVNIERKETWDNLSVEDLDTVLSHQRQAPIVFRGAL